MGELSCFECKKARVHGGFGGTYEIPPEPAECECDYASEEAHELTEEERARACPGFDPHQTGPCAECKKQIEHPRFLWPLTVMTAWENVPVCSEECKTKLKVKVDAEIAEMRLQH